MEQSATQLPPAIEHVPDVVRSQLDGEAGSIVAWSLFDLTDDGKLGSRHLVLTEHNLIVLDNGRKRSIPVDELTAAKVVEGLGVDRLVVVAGEQVRGEFPYSRHCRREMTRLHRKLERKLPGEDGKPKERPPDWLDVVERQTEAKEYCSKCKELIPSYAEGVCPKCLHKRSVLTRLIAFVRPYRGRFLMAMALMLVLVVTQNLPMLVTKQTMDKALASSASADERVRQLFIWCSVTFSLIVISELLGGLHMRILTNVGTMVARDLRHAVYDHMHDLSLRYFAKRRTGSLITRVTNDTDRLWDFIVFGSVGLARAMLLVLTGAGMMFWMNWQLALVALIPMPIVAVMSYYRGKTMHRIFGRLWTYWSRMGAVVGDAVPGVRVVKAFANEKREVKRFDDRSDEYTRKEQEANNAWTSFQPVVGGIMRIGSLTVTLIGGYIIIRHPSDKNTLGTLMAFTQALWQFYWPISELANSNRMVTRSATSAQRVFEVLDTPPEIYSNTSAISKPKLEGKIEFRSVSFSYEGAQPALREVNMAIEAGEMVGLCGPSGAGKTTLVNLVCRFYDPTDGQILIDGIDIRDYDVKWLRRQVGVVLQEPYLFHGTIAENIRYGNPDATLEEVIRAAKAANSHDFVVGFPDGYDTIVGERGQSLSGGERQRISIARAILHDPKILILDEATSSVDTETEKQIQQALDRLVEGRTTIAIAHRLSTLQSADRLIVLEKGKVAETGKHDELVNKPDGVYAKLHKTQVEMSTLVAIQ